MSQEAVEETCDHTGHTHELSVEPQACLEQQSGKVLGDNVLKRTRGLSILHSETDQTHDEEALTKGPRRLSIHLLVREFRIQSHETKAPAHLRDL